MNEVTRLNALVAQPTVQPQQALVSQPLAQQISSSQGEPVLLLSREYQLVFDRAISLTTLTCEGGVMATVQRLLSKSPDRSVSEVHRKLTLLKTAVGNLGNASLFVNQTADGTVGGQVYDTSATGFGTASASNPFASAASSGAFGNASGPSALNTTSTSNVFNNPSPFAAPQQSAFGVTAPPAATAPSLLSRLGGFSNAEPQAAAPATNPFGQVVAFQNTVGTSAPPQVSQFGGSAAMSSMSQGQPADVNELRRQVDQVRPFQLSGTSAILKSATAAPPRRAHDAPHGPVHPVCPSCWLGRCTQRDHDRRVCV